MELTNQKQYIQLLNEYTNTGYAEKYKLPYPTVEEFCLHNEIDILELKQWCIDDAELKLAVRRVYLKAYTILDKYLTVDLKTVTFGKDGSAYKLDKAGVIHKLKELRELLDSY